MSNVTFVLDEAASLGRMDALDDAVDKYRGYGVRLQFYYQSVSQLRKCFPDGQEQTLLSNVSQVLFGTNDLPTAEYVSNRLGEADHRGQQRWDQHGNLAANVRARVMAAAAHSTNASDNWSQMGRKLLKPEEVLAFG